MAQKDTEGQRRFAPFWRLYLGNNPLENAEAHLAQLKEIGVRLNVE